MGASADMVLQPYGAFLAGRTSLLHSFLSPISTNPPANLPTSPPLYLFSPTGSAAGVLSTIGYKTVSGKLFNSLKIHDTCGVSNSFSVELALATAGEQPSWHARHPRRCTERTRCSHGLVSPNQPDLKSSRSSFIFSPGKRHMVQSFTKFSPFVLLARSVQIDSSWKIR